MLFQNPDFSGDFISFYFLKMECLFFPPHLSYNPVINYLTRSILVWIKLMQRKTTFNLIFKPYIFKIKEMPVPIKYLKKNLTMYFKYNIIRIIICAPTTHIYQILGI